jgi:hypothetical protein
LAAQNFVITVFAKITNRMSFVKMISVALENRSFLKERMLKFWIVMIFVPVWLLVLGIYYSRGQQYMPSVQRSILQFILTVYSITLAMLIAAGALAFQSKKAQTDYRCSAVQGEIIGLCFVIALQILAAVALSAGTPSFQCSQEAACGGNIFLAIVAWLPPLLFSVHTIEFVVRARRIAALEPLLWWTAVRLVRWEDLEYYRTGQDMVQAHSKSVDIDAVEKGLPVSRGPPLVTKTVQPAPLLTRTITHVPSKGNSQVPQFRQPSQTSRSPRFNDQGRRVAVGRTQRHGARPHRQSFNRLSLDQGVYLIIPETIQYTVPRLEPAPKTRRGKRSPPPAKSWYR